MHHSTKKAGNSEGIMLWTSISFPLPIGGSDSAQTHTQDLNRSIVTSATLSWRRLAGSTAHSPSERGRRHRSCHRCGHSWLFRSWWHRFQGSAAQLGSLRMPVPGASSQKASLSGPKLNRKKRQAKLLIIQWTLILRGQHALLFNLTLNITYRYIYKIREWFLLSSSKSQIGNYWCVFAENWVLVLLMQYPLLVFALQHHRNHILISMI